MLFRRLGLFEQVTHESDNEIVGITIQFENDFKGAGRSEILTPSYVARKSSKGSIIAQFKEGRYRVTFSEIRSRV